MILYVGRAIPLMKQFMPNKPIKNGVKTYQMCDSPRACDFQHGDIVPKTGYLYSFEIFTGTAKFYDAFGSTSIFDNNVVSVVSRLFQNCGFETTGAGRNCYTDNYYTRMNLMVHLWTHYKMYLTGTVRLTKKKSRMAKDFPFHKLSNGALKRVKRGWLRRAVFIADTPNGIGAPRTMEVEADVWKDRRLVGFLTNHDIGPPAAEHNVLRHMSNRPANSVHGNRHPTPAPRCAGDYGKGMGAVDHEDRHVADRGGIEGALRCGRCAGTCAYGGTC